MPAFSRLGPLDPANSLELLRDSVRVLPRDWFMGIWGGVRLESSAWVGSGFPAAAAAAEAANSSASAYQKQDRLLIPRTITLVKTLWD